MMDIFDIYIAYVSWNDSGKMRPVLILEQQGAIVFVFNITTQYENKSKAVRSNYFKIIDWQQSGLNQQSYVDINIVRDLPSAALEGRVAIGKLTQKDAQRLFEFLQ